MKSSLLFSIIISSYSYSQCYTKDILVFNMGENKFKNQLIESANKLERNEFFYWHPTSYYREKWTEEDVRGLVKALGSVEAYNEDLRMQTEQDNKTHEKQKYPDNEKYVSSGEDKADSIYQVVRYLEGGKTGCVRGTKRNFILKFADDTLYSIRLNIDYKKEDALMMQQDYNVIVSELKSKCYFIPFTSNDNYVVPQTGEGFYFFPYKWGKNKIELYSVGIYGYGEDSDINYYVQINYVNTRHTRFLNRKCGGDDFSNFDMNHLQNSKK